jgi:two-component system response regulator VanR
MDIQILVVEDDKSICDMVKRLLVKAGYNVDICADGDSALERFYNKNYHLVILDIMLPGINGQELLKELRKIHDTPVLMMTALSDDDNQIKAFMNEADDYVTKPFSMQVLLMRVEALLRRSGALKKEIRVGNLVLYPESCGVEYAGETIQIAPKEFELLMYLAQNKNKVMPHRTLLIKIWGYDFDGNENIVQANIGKLRNKMPVNIIKTVKGVGYSLMEEPYEE